MPMNMTVNTAASETTARAMPYSARSWPRSSAQMRSRMEILRISAAPSVQKARRAVALRALSRERSARGRIDGRLALRPQRVHARADRDRDQPGARCDDCQRDPVLSEILTGLITNQLLQNIEHGNCLL